MRDVNRAMDKGWPGDAAGTLRDCVHQLRAYGPAEAVSEAIRSLDDVERMIHEGWGARSRKSSRYRVASYMKMSSAEQWSLDDGSAPSFKKGPPKR